MSNEKISAEDYEKLKIFITVFFDSYEAQPYIKPEHHPLLELARIQKEHGLANAKRGLLMGINDMVEKTTSWHPEQVAQANAKFTAAGTFTLSEIRQRYSKKYLQILKRGVIKSETEYYILKGVVDGSSIEAGAIESTQIEAMMATFETELIRKLASE